MVVLKAFLPMSLRGTHQPCCSFLVTRDSSRAIQDQRHDRPLTCFLVSEETTKQIRSVRCHSYYD